MQSMRDNPPRLLPCRLNACVTEYALPLPQSTHDNPPMLLPCGHCICKASILKIAKVRF